MVDAAWNPDYFRQYLIEKVHLSPSEADQIYQGFVINKRDLLSVMRESFGDDPKTLERYRRIRRDLC